jgi:hypothetical protein
LRVSKLNPINASEMATPGAAASGVNVTSDGGSASAAVVAGAAHAPKASVSTIVAESKWRMAVTG